MYLFIYIFINLDISKIPTDVVINISKYLSVEDFCNFSMVIN